MLSWSGAETRILLNPLLTEVLGNVGEVERGAVVSVGLLAGEVGLEVTELDALVPEVAAPGVLVPGGVAGDGKAVFQPQKYPAPSIPAIRRRMGSKRLATVYYLRSCIICYSLLLLA